MTVAVRYYTRSGNTKKLAEAIAAAVGVQMAGEEFHCFGSFLMLHRGRPNADDCAAAAAFAKKITG